MWTFGLFVGISNNVTVAATFSMICLTGSRDVFLLGGKMNRCVEGSSVSIPIFWPHREAMPRKLPFTHGLKAGECNVPDKKVMDVLRIIALPILQSCMDKADNMKQVITFKCSFSIIPTTGSLKPGSKEAILTRVFIVDTDVQAIAPFELLSS